MEVNDEAELLENLNSLDKTKNLSYIIENDEDYGSKLTELLSFNSDGAPVLSISKIKFPKSQNTIDNTEIESLIDGLFSQSDIVNASEIQYNSNFDSDNNFFEYNSDEDYELKSERDVDNEVGISVSISKETSGSTIHSNKPNSHSDSVYCELDNAVVDKEFEYDQKSEGARLNECSYKCQIESGESGSAEEELGLDYKSKCNKEAKRAHNSNKPLINCEQYLEKKTESADTALNCGVHHNYGDAKRDIETETADDNLCEETKTDYVHEEQIHGSFDGEFCGSNTKSTLKTQTESYHLPEAALNKTLDLENDQDRDNVDKWRLKIMSTMRSCNERRSFNDRYFHCEGIKDSKDSICPENCFGINHNNPLLKGDSVGGSSALTRVSSSRDLKSDIISEIENELKNCRLSFCVDSSFKTSAEGVCNDILSCDLYMDDGECDSMEDNATLLHTKNENNDFVSDTELSVASQNPKLDLNNSFLSTLNMSRVNELQCFENNNASTLNGQVHAFNYDFAEKNTQIDFPNTPNFTQNTDLEKNILGFEDTLRLESANNDCGNGRLGKSSLDQSDHNLREVDLANTKIECMDEKSVGSFQITTPNPNDIVLAIKLLAIVRDVKRQIGLIKNKRFVEYNDAV